MCHTHYYLGFGLNHEAISKHYQSQITKCQITSLIIRRSFIFFVLLIEPHPTSKTCDHGNTKRNSDSASVTLCSTCGIQVCSAYVSTSLGDKESGTIGKGRHIPYPTDQERIEEDISAAGFDDEVIEKGSSEHESAFQGERSKEKEEVLGKDGGEFDRMRSSPDSTQGTGSKYSTGHEIPDVERNTSDTESEARTEEDNARKKTVLPDGETEPQKMTSQPINHENISKEQEEVLGEDGGEFDRMSSSPDSTQGTGSKYSTGHEIPDVERNTSDTENEARTEEDNARKKTVLPDGETEPQKMTSQPINHDISTLKKSRMNDETKLWHIQNRMPEINFKFPGKMYKDKSESSGFKQRYCKREWLQHHEYLSYSKEADGLFCLACLLFPVRAYRGQRANNLINTPYQNWKDAISNLRKHATLEYHIRSKMTMDGFLETTRNPSLNLASRMSSKIAEQVASNRKIPSLHHQSHRAMRTSRHRSERS